MNFDHNKDYNGMLGITPRAELTVIKATSKALAAAYHPDRNSTKKTVIRCKLLMRLGRLFLTDLSEKNTTRRLAIRNLKVMLLTKPVKLKMKTMLLKITLRKIGTCFFLLSRFSRAC